MVLRTKVEPIAQFVEVVAREDLSPPARSKAVADFARGELVKAQQANARALGRVPHHETFVDGRHGAPLETVKPNGGRIVFEFELIDDALRWIACMLVERSPVRSGEYVRGHRLFADGIEVAVSATGVVPPAEVYTFTNLVPYARKIEVGKTAAGRDFVIQVPNRIYERTAKDAKARFGNFMKIAFGYRAPIGGAIRAYGGAASRRGGIEHRARAPAIIVTLR
jgi:hypothetical protein